MKYLESNSQKQKLEWWFPGGWGGEEKRLNGCLMGMEFQFCKMKKVLTMDGGDVKVFNTTELCT